MSVEASRPQKTSLCCSMVQCYVNKQALKRSLHGFVERLQCYKCGLFVTDWTDRLVIDWTSSLDSLLKHLNDICLFLAV